MSGAVRIRPMDLDDLGAVFRLGRRSWGAVDVPYNWWTIGEVAHHLEHDPTLCHVAEADGRVVGFVMGDGTFELFADTGHLEWLAVDPDYRRRGIATLLLETALDAYRRLGRASVAADIATANRASQEVVRRLGFEEGVSVTFFMKDLGGPPGK